MKRIALCVILAPALLLVIQAATAALLLPAIQMPDGGAGLGALSAAVTALTLAVLAVTLAPSGWPRAATLFLAAAGIPANNLIEAVFFSLDIPRAHLLPLFLYTLVSGALIAAALDRLAPPSSAGIPAAEERG